MILGGVLGMTLAVTLVVVVICKTTPEITANPNMLLNKDHGGTNVVNVVTHALKHEGLLASKRRAGVRIEPASRMHAAQVVAQAMRKRATAKHARRAVAPKHQLTQLNLTPNFRVSSKFEAKETQSQRSLAIARKEAESLAKDVDTAEKSAHSIHAKRLPNKLANNLSNLSPVQLERNRMKAIEVMEEATLKKRERENELAEKNMAKLTGAQKKKLQLETKLAQGELQQGLDDEHLALKWEHQAQKEHDGMVLAKQKALDYSEANKGKLSNAKYEQIRATTQLAEASEDMKHASIDLATHAKDTRLSKAEQQRALDMGKLVQKQRKAVSNARHQMDALELNAEKAQQKVEAAKVDLMQSKRDAKKHPGLLHTAQEKLKEIQKEVKKSGVLNDEKIKTKMYQHEEHLLDHLETRQVQHREKAEHLKEFAVMSKDKAKRLTEEALDAQHLAGTSRARAENLLKSAQKSLELARAQHHREEQLVGRYVQERRQAKRYEMEADKHFADGNKISLKESISLH
jgi:hypothetical protein